MEKSYLSRYFDTNNRSAAAEWHLVVIGTSQIAQFDVLGTSGYQVEESDIDKEWHCGAYGTITSHA